MFDVDDFEQFFFFFIEEEKKIIGLIVCLVSGESRSNLVDLKKYIDLKFSLLNFLILSLCNNILVCIKLLGNNSSDKVVKLSYFEGDIKFIDVYMVIKVEEVEEDNLIERIIDSNVKVKEESVEMFVDFRFDCVGKSYCFVVINEKFSKLDKLRKRKSVLF